ncbi:MAG TPA: DinB family protein, partial [Dehalococcoidia bacterium]|nr:DinB family protein [Dehalococcoidia bacterium]
PSLQQQLDQKVQEIKQAVSSIDEQKAAKPPAEGEWCAKEVLSHVSGEDGSDAVSRYRRILEEDTPLLEIHPGISYYEGREKASVGELLARIENQYGELGAFLAGLNEEQLNRKAHVPLLRETPIGEYPTLSQQAMGLIHYHLNDHVNQLGNLSQQ